MQPVDTGYGVKGLILEDDKVLVLLKPNGENDLPGGRLEPNENVLDGLRREIPEETGIKEILITNSFVPWFLRKRPDYLIKGTTWLCHSQGGLISVGNEHKGYAWKPTNELRDLEIFHKYGLSRLVF